MESSLIPSQGSCGLSGWTRNIRHLSSLGEIAFGNILKHTHDHFQLLPSATSTSLAGLPFDNWSLPDTDELDGLVAGWSGDSATSWLMKYAHMSSSLVLSQNAHFFERNRFQWLRGVFHVVGRPYGLSEVSLLRSAHGP